MKTKPAKSKPKTATRQTAKGCRRPSFCSAGEVLAVSVFRTARDAGMFHEDLVSCCSVILSIIADSTGETLDYLLAEVERRARTATPPNDKAEAPSLSEVDPPAAG